MHNTTPSRAVYPHRKELTMTNITTDFDKFCETFNAQDLEYIVRESYGYNTSLEDYYFLDFDAEFFDKFFENDPAEAARATHFGNVDWDDDRIRFDAWDNLETISDSDYEDLLIENREEIVEEAIELFKYWGSKAFDEEISNRIAEYLNK
jgi:hypothetical protein